MLLLFLQHVLGGVAIPKLTETQIQEARDIDLLSYFQTHAPNAIRRSGVNEYCLREHDSLKISNGLWHWWSRGIGGKSALDYLIKVEGMSFVDAVEHLTGREVIRTHRPIAPKPRDPPKPFKLPPPNRNNDRAYAYLRGRGIGKELINRCIADGLLYESANTHRCVFVGKDGDTPKFACERGTRDGWKKDVAGSDKRFSFHLPPTSENCSVLAVFEGAADVLAHHELYKNWDGYRLSLGGTSSLALTSFLERNPQIRGVALCLDNDAAGYAATSRIIRELAMDKRFSHLDVAVKPPATGKDYGEMLENVQKQKIQEPTRHRAGISI